jgi:hypothetical protein
MEPCTKDSEENIDSGKDVNKKIASFRSQTHMHLIVALVFNP